MLWLFIQDDVKKGRPCRGQVQGLEVNSSCKYYGESLDIPKYIANRSTVTIICFTYCLQSYIEYSYNIEYHCRLCSSSISVVIYECSSFNCTVSFLNSTDHTTVLRRYLYIMCLYLCFEVYISRLKVAILNGKKDNGLKLLVCWDELFFLCNVVFWSTFYYQYILFCHLSAFFWKVD